MNFIAGSKSLPVDIKQLPIQWCGGNYYTAEVNQAVSKTYRDELTTGSVEMN